MTMKTKKLPIIIIAAALALTAALAGCSAKKDRTVPDGMKLASDPELAGYTFFVPESWSVDIRTASTRAYCPGADKSSVMVMTGELEHTDSTVEGWWESGIDELKALYSDFELISREDAELDGAKGEKFVYSGTFDGTQFKYSQVAAVKGGVIYVVTYGATADRWDSHLEEFSSMIGNFRFGK